MAGKRKRSAAGPEAGAAHTIMYSNVVFMRGVGVLTTSTGLYRSCAALASFSDTFDLIFLKKLILNLLLRKFGLVWFG